MGGGGGLSVYHLAIEDSVEIDKIWDAMEKIFNADDQDIQVCMGGGCGRGEGLPVPLCYNLAIEDSVNMNNIWNVLQPIYGDDVLGGIQV